MLSDFWEGAPYTGGTGSIFSVRLDPRTWFSFVGDDAPVTVKRDSVMREHVMVKISLFTHHSSRFTNRLGRRRP